MDNNVAQAVLKTLAYYDLFAYPVTLQELHRYLIASRVVSLQQVKNELNRLQISKKNNFYFLKGKDAIVAQRIKREKISHKKLQLAKKIATRLSRIPTIVYIGVSGSLAMQNAKKNDDIDLFIITKPYTLWISRLLASLLLVVTGKLRRFGQVEQRDAICLNMWVETRYMKFKERRQNVYTAHEIVQLYTLYNQYHTYEQFLYANTWITQVLPHTIIHKVHVTRFPSSKSMRILNTIVKKMQMWYMKQHKTSETISDGFVAFHPMDYTQKILQSWKEQTVS